MIAYHGLPITPDAVAAQILQGRHAFVTFAYPGQATLAVEACRSFALDNGAFTAWKNGTPITDWRPFYAWTKDCLRFPGCDWAVIPDVIEGGEEENDALLCEWPFSKHLGVPVWHMHESVERIERMIADGWGRVAIGSSAEYAQIGTDAWWERMALAMSTLTDEDGFPRVKIHGLRMLNPDIFTKIPFSSCDSTNVAQNHWRGREDNDGRLAPPNKAWRGMLIAARIEANNSATRWSGPRVVQNIF